MEIDLVELILGCLEPTSVSDLKQTTDRLKDESRNAWYRSRSQREAIDGLISANAELKLFLVALMRLLISKGIVTLDDLRTMVASVDVEDGQADGRYTGPLRQWPLTPKIVRKITPKVVRKATARVVARTKKESDSK